MTDAVWLLTSLMLGLIFGNFLPRYFSKKGENLATKEDIEEITKKIETVRHDYASQLETAKAELSAKLNTHGFRYENEYNILSELTALLVDVRDASVNLRPTIDFKDPSKSEDDIKKERLKHLHDARRALYLTREKKRPFYPEDVYQTILAVDKTVHRESVKYRHENPFSQGNFQSYWDEAEKNQHEITRAAETGMEKIRSRITYWETLKNNL